MNNLRNSIQNQIRELLVFSIVLLLSLFGSSAVFAFTPDSQVRIQVQNASQQNQIQKHTIIVCSEQDFPPFATGMSNEETHVYSDFYLPHGVLQVGYSLAMRLKLASQ